MVNRSGNAVIEQIYQEILGFTDLDQLKYIYDFASKSALDDGSILEVGSWCGRSAITIASALKNKGSLSKVYCVDLFPNLTDWQENKDGTYSIRLVINDISHSAYTEEHKIWGETFRGRFLPAYRDDSCLMNIFKMNAQKFGVEDILIPHRGTIETFVKDNTDSSSVKLAFIDGDHDASGVALDLETVNPLLLDNGLLCIDDYGGVFEAITNVTERFKLENSEYTNKGTYGRKMAVLQKR